MSAWERLGVFQNYLPKKKIENNYAWQWAPMWMILDIKQQGLRHKSGIVIGGHVMEMSEHTTYSLKIKYISFRLMLMISVKKVFGLMTGDIISFFCTAPCTENIWYMVKSSLRRTMTDHNCSTTFGGHEKFGINYLGCCTGIGRMPGPRIWFTWRCFRRSCYTGCRRG